MHLEMALEQLLILVMTYSSDTVVGVGLEREVIELS